jgi:hypothetical protein
MPEGASSWWKRITRVSATSRTGRQRRRHNRTDRPGYHWFMKIRPTAAGWSWSNCTSALIWPRKAACRSLSCSPSAITERQGLCLCDRWDQPALHAPARRRDERRPGTFPGQRPCCSRPIAAILPFQPSDKFYSIIAFFNMPYDKSLELTQPLALPVSSALVIVPEGIKVKSDQLTDDGIQQTQQGFNVQMYSGSSLSAGSPLEMTLSGQVKSAALGG